MKKTAAILIFLLVLFSLTGCDLLNGLFDEEEDLEITLENTIWKLQTNYDGMREITQNFP